MHGVYPRAIGRRKRTPWRSTLLGRMFGLGGAAMPKDQSFLGAFLVSLHGAEDDVVDFSGGIERDLEPFVSGLLDASAPYVAAHSKVLVHEGRLASFLDHRVSVLSPGGTEHGDHLRLGGLALLDSGDPTIIKVS